MIESPSLLAQQSARQNFSSEVFLWLGLIVVAAVVLALIAMWLRKVFSRDIEPGPTLGFTLADLREMHAQGQLSDAEFESAKAKMLAKSRRALDEDEAKRAAPERILPLSFEAGEPSRADDPGEDVDNPADVADPAEGDPDKNGDPPPRA